MSNVYTAHSVSHYTSYHFVPELKEKINRCYHEAPSVGEITLGLRDDSKQIEQRINVLGVELERYNPDLLSDFIKLFQIKKYEKSIGFSISDLTHITKSCDDVLCLTKKVFGEEKGPLILYLLKNYNINVSPYSYSEFYFDRIASVNSLTSFTLKELRLILTVLRLFPDGVLDRFSNQDLKIVNFNKNNYMGDSAIKVYKIWSEKDFRFQASTIIHEIAHNVDLAYFGFNERLSLQDEFSRIHKMDGKLRENSKKNAKEDFADSFTSYMLAPNFLKIRSPERYHFMRDVVFKGREYIDNQSCDEEGIEHDTLKSFDVLLRGLNDFEIKKEVQDKCSYKIVDYLINGIETPLLQCLSYHLQNQPIAESYASSVLNYIKRHSSFKKFIRAETKKLLELTSKYLICDKFTHVDTSEIDTSHYFYRYVDKVKLCRWVKNYKKSNKENVSDKNALRNILNQRKLFYE